MKKIDIGRAWKDEQYRLSLTPEELAQLPANPAGVVDLADEDLSTVLGGLLADDGGCTCNCCTCDCCTCNCCTCGCCGGDEIA